MKRALSILSIVIGLLLPSVVFAAGPNLGPVMFLGNSGYRGYLVSELLGDGAAFSTIGTSTQMTSPTLNGFGGTYIKHEGHPGATIEDLYSPGANPTNTNEIAKVSFNQVAATPGYTPQIPYSPQNPYRSPHYVYLMIGSNNAEDTPQEQAQSLNDELALINYIKSVDGSLVRIFVEPPPSFPSASDGNVPDGYDMYSAALGAALLIPPYNAFVTFVDSRLKLTSADFAIDQGQTGRLHPNDAGYQIIATDLFNATITSSQAAPEPGALGLLSVGTLLLLAGRRSIKRPA